MSEDYAIPPDALSQADSTYMDASLPSILMRSSYVDSPNKKMESLEKVNICICYANSMAIKLIVILNGTTTFDFTF